MSRRNRMPKMNRPKGVPGGWGGLVPVAGLCAITLISALAAFGGRGGVEAASGAACVTDAVPGQFETWTAFFRRYPFDDAFLKARIEAVNGDTPGEIVTIPLAVEASCATTVVTD